MTTFALWHLGVSGILAGALSMVILVQSLGDGLRRMRRTTRPARTVPTQVRPAAEPRTVRTAARTSDQAPALASAAGAR